MKGPRTEEERSDTKGPRTEEERTDRRTNGVAVAKVEVSRGPFREILNGLLDTEGFEKTRRRPRWPEVRLGKS